MRDGFVVVWIGVCLFVFGMTCGGFLEGERDGLHPCDKLERHNDCKGEEGSYVCVWVDSDQQVRRAECREVEP